MGKNTLYILTVKIAGIEFTTIPLKPDVAKELREALSHLPFTWSEIQLGDDE